MMTKLFVLESVQPESQSPPPGIRNVIENREGILSVLRKEVAIS